MTSRELKPLMTGLGLSVNTVSPQITAAGKRGWVKTPVYATYQLTAEGVAECKRRGFEATEPKAKAKKNGAKHG